MHHQAGWYHQLAQLLTVQDDAPPRAVLGALGALLPDDLFSDSLTVGETPLLYPHVEPVEGGGRRWTVLGVIDDYFVHVTAASAEDYWSFDTHRDAEIKPEVDAWLCPISDLSEIRTIHAYLHTPPGGEFHLRAAWSIALGERRIRIDPQRTFQDQPAERLIERLRSSWKSG